MTLCIINSTTDVSGVQHWIQPTEQASQCTGLQSLPTLHRLSIELPVTVHFKPKSTAKLWKSFGLSVWVIKETPEIPQEKNINKNTIWAFKFNFIFNSTTDGMRVESFSFVKTKLTTKTRKQSWKNYRFLLKSALRLIKVDVNRMMLTGWQLKAWSPKSNLHNWKEEKLTTARWKLPQKYYVKGDITS